MIQLWLKNYVIMYVYNYTNTGADIEGGAPGARPLFALIHVCKTKKINLRVPVQPDNSNCCAPGFNIFWIRAWNIIIRYLQIHLEVTPTDQLNTADNFLEFSTENIISAPRLDFVDGLQSNCFYTNTDKEKQVNSVIRLIFEI